MNLSTETDSIAEMPLERRWVGQGERQYDEDGWLFESIWSSLAPRCPALA
jgi:hypothetical protein